MKLPQLYSELGQLNNFKLTPLMEVLRELDVNDIETRFKKELHNWMCAVLDQQIYFTSELSSTVMSYIDEGKITFDEKYRNDVGFYNYLIVVLQELELIKNNTSLDDNLMQKTASFESYLQQNKQRFYELDAFIRITKMKVIYKDLREMAKLTIKHSFIDFAKFNSDIRRLFYFTDCKYALKLLNPNNYQDCFNQTYEGFKEFDFNYYKSPPIYEANTREKEKYLRFLKALILENIESRKSLVNWNTLPDEYNKLKLYANSLFPGIDVKTSVEIPLELFKPETNQVIDYPKHIFLNQQSFQLFNLLMESFQTHATVSFVFRMMSEKENPCLIVVKDTPFREWFNQQTYKIKLETHTKTFENAKSSDRIALYKLAKQMTFNKS